MVLIWLVIGIMLGLLNTYSQWRVIQRLNPGQNQRASLQFVIGSSGLRLFLTGIIILTAVLQDITFGLILLFGMIISRWAHLAIMNNNPIWKNKWKK